MVKILSIIFLIVTFTLCCHSEETETGTEHNLLAVETPEFFSDQPSPLAKPKESLQQKEYYDFLSTLYRHDKTKAGLFENTEAVAEVRDRKKRTIVFRPLFVYRQQQIKRKRAKARAKARRV